MPAQHLEDAGKGDVNEAVNQIAFADIILLNKIDLVSPEELQVRLAAGRAGRQGGAAAAAAGGNAPAAALAWQLPQAAAPACPRAPPWRRRLATWCGPST